MDMIYLFFCALFCSFSVTSGLECKSCTHISHEMENVPQDQVSEIDAYLKQLENKDCLSTTINPEKNETCVTSQEVNVNGSAKCITAHVDLDAKGMGNVAKDAILRIHFYGRNCMSDLPKSEGTGCVGLDGQEHAHKRMKELLDPIVKNWTQRTYKGEICYHDNNELFPDSGMSSVPVLMAKPKMLQP